jgi:hypothetical protein
MTMTDNTLLLELGSANALHGRASSAAQMNMLALKRRMFAQRPAELLYNVRLGQLQEVKTV